MADQVASLNHEPRRFQIGEPDAPCGGSSTCTDTVVAQIVRHETGKTVSAADVRAAAAPHKDPCRGLNPSEALRALQHFGVRGYRIHINPTASDVLRATDNGIVLVAVGYDGFPLARECEVGGRTDTVFTGPHAISVWGRRLRGGRWMVWTRDPDHHYGAPGPRYDRFESRYLVRAMDALIGNEGWQVRLAIYRDAPPLIGLHPHAVEVMELLPELPDFGSGQAGDPKGG